jgi:hypothetical protein
MPRPRAFLAEFAVIRRRTHWEPSEPAATSRGSRHLLRRSGPHRHRVRGGRRAILKEGNKTDVLSVKLLGGALVTTGGIAW